MAIERTESGGVLITGEHIGLYRALSVCGALALKINTGLEMTPSVWQTANQISATLDVEQIREAVKEKGVRLSVPTLGAKRTERGAMADLVLFLIVVWDWEPTASAKRALGEEMLGNITRKAERIVAVVRPEGAA